jgi:tetratricopeptide (TPR) repeat protein
MPSHRGTETTFELTTIERLELLGYSHTHGEEIVRPHDAVVLMPDPLDKIQTLTGVVYFNLSFREYPHQPGLALIQAKAGDRAGVHKSVERALALLPDVKDLSKQARARTAVVCTQVKLGDIAAAMQTAQAIQKPEWHTVASGAIAHGQALAGRYKRALQTIESLADKEDKVHALYQMALGQTQAGDRKAARETLQQAIDLAKILPEQAASLHFHNIASVQAVAGDFRGALATAKEFLNPQSIVFWNIAHEQVKAGDLKGAMETAQLLEDAWSQGNTYRDMARVLVQSGKEKEAVAWAKDLPTSLFQGNALLGAAEGLIQPGNPE